LKAAVFDFLIDAQDRGEGNFLVDPSLKKIWLVDHDIFMFTGLAFTRGKMPSDTSILTEAVGRRLTEELSEEIVVSVQRLHDKIDQLISKSGNPKVQGILAGIKKRAEILIKEKAIKT
jgi:hypothetical protein